MASATVDPFTAEIVRNALDAICEQMATTIAYGCRVQTRVSGP